MDEGYYIFWDIQNSPAYLAMREIDAFAIIRQLGFLSIFIRQSVAETKWKDLLKCLGTTVHNKEYTSKEIDTMDYKTKCELIQGDSATLVHFFENCFNVFMKDVVNSKCKQIGEVTDYFWRKEFASRGAIDVHWFAYINDAPEYGESSNEYVADYYKTVSCSSDYQKNTKSKLIIEYTGILNIFMLANCNIADFYFHNHQCHIHVYWNPFWLKILKRKM